MLKNSLIWVVIALLGVMLAAGPALAGPKDDIRAGMKAAQNGDMEKAIELFTKAIKTGKLSKQNLAITYTNRGAANEDMGQTDLAVLDYNRAIKADPSYSIAYTTALLPMKRKICWTWL